MGGLAPQLLIEFGNLLHRDTLALHSSFDSMLSAPSKRLAAARSWPGRSEAWAGAHFLLIETWTSFAACAGMALELSLRPWFTGRQHWH